MTIDVEKTLWGLLSEQDKTNDKILLLARIIDRQMDMLREIVHESTGVLQLTTDLRAKFDQIDDRD